MTNENHASPIQYPTIGMRGEEEQGAGAVEDDNGGQGRPGTDPETAGRHGLRFDQTSAWMTGMATRSVHPTSAARKV